MKFLLSILYIIFFISVSYSSYAKCNFNCSKEKKTTSLVFEHNSKFNEKHLNLSSKTLGDDLGFGHKWETNVRRNLKDWNIGIIKNSPEKARLGSSYLRFETKEGYHYRSIDSLVSQDPYEIEYTYTPGVVDNSDPDKDFKILSYETKFNQNLIQNLERGAYCTYRMYYNPISGRFTTPQQGLFKVSDYAEKMENLGKDFEIFLPPVDKKNESLGDVPSRYVTGVLDYGTLERKGSRSRAKNADPMEYHSQAMMRYNTIFTMQLEATIPLNTNLCSGSVIKCKFAKITTDKTKVIDDEQSGLYMIKELVHYYETRGSFTKLKLIRDTMGKKDK